LDFRKYLNKDAKMNKKSTFKYILLLLSLFFVQKTVAQKGDKIHITDGSIITVKVVSVKGDSVFYRPHFASSQTVLFGLPKTSIDKIIYQNGNFEFYGGKVVNYPIQGRQRKTDIIYRKDGSELSVIIVSTTEDSIQYRAAFKDADKILFSVSKSDVYRIGYTNGFIEDISPMSAENMRIVNENIRIGLEKNGRERDSLQIKLERHKNIIKVSPFTLVKNYMVFGYERSIRKGQSTELKVGFIGWSPEKYELPARGAFGSIAYKWIMKPDDEKFRRPRSLLHGLYFRPELAFGSYKQTYVHETYRGSNSKPDIQEGKHSVSYRCFVFTMGKQWISDSFVFDLFAGMGTGVYEQTASSFGVVKVTRFGYRMDMDAIKGSSVVKFKIGLYLGFNF
jgi:hypothetical protein